MPLWEVKQLGSYSLDMLDQCDWSPRIHSVSWKTPQNCFTTSSWGAVLKRPRISQLSILNGEHMSMGLERSLGRPSRDGYREYQTSAITQGFSVYLCYFLILTADAAQPHVCT